MAWHGMIQNAGINLNELRGNWMVIELTNNL
jgi:hypothetical protein